MKKTRFVENDSYEYFASNYQVILIKLLDDALRECGIKPKKKRKQICESFFVSHSTLHDQCWLKTKKGRVHPLLWFSETFQNVDMSAKELGGVYVDKDRTFSFDEYLWPALRYVYDEAGTDTDISVGLVGDEPSE